MSNANSKLLVKRAEAAAVLAVSESQLRKWERLTWLTPIRYPGMRSVAYAAAEVEALGRRIIAEGRATR